MNDWVYILSPSFSGSTLLTFLVGAHPAVATIGELKATAMGNVQRYKCSCGERILDCAFWRRVREGMISEGKTFEFTDFRTELRLQKQGLADRVLRSRIRGRLFEVGRRWFLALAPGVRGEIVEIVERNRALARVITREQGGKVFLDASKEPARLLHLRRSGLGEIKVLSLLRDGRGTACSFMNHYGMSMAEAAEVWRESQESCQRIVQRIPTVSSLEVRYETLCAHPKETLDDIFGFVGVETGESVHDFRGIEQHILGNAMRLKNSGEVRLDEKWRSLLSSGDLNTFERIAGQLNRRLGYA